MDVFSFIISFLVSYVIDRKTAKKVKELSVYRRKGRKNTSLKMAKKEIKIKAKVLGQKIEFSISFVSDLINLILDFVEKEY